MTDELEPILLSPPHLFGREQALLGEAVASNWIAPLGPQVDQFEAEFARAVGAKAALAVSSGTAALHLALLEAGVRPGDDVLVSTLTFVGSVNPIVYCGANPVFIDAERESWNMDPDLLERTLTDRAARGRLPKAVLVVHLYGQTADLAPIVAACARYGIPLVEDAAEALGATYRDRSAGVFGQSGVFSFNGNKIITTSGGGMLVSEQPGLLEHARKLATQAREPFDHYEHTEVGYNYRMSNLLAAVGRAQLETLDVRVAARRRNFAFYQARLSGLPGLTFMPEAHWGRHSRWLTTLLVDAGADIDREHIRRALTAQRIESRPLWKPMHLQPVFRSAESVGGEVAADLFARGLCLPSGSSLTEVDLGRVCQVIEDAYRQERAGI